MNVFLLSKYQDIQKIFGTCSNYTVQLLARKVSAYFVDKFSVFFRGMRPYF